MTSEQLKEKKPIELYAILNSHMLEGVMFHNDMSDYFNFLGLHGFKRIHEYQFYEENLNRRIMCRKVLDIHNTLIPNEKVEIKEYIPKDWYKYTRMDIDDTIIPKFVREGWKKYKEWEEETKELYCNVARAFYDKNMLIDFNIVMNLLEDVQEELKKIYRMCGKLNDTAYDPVYIMEMQEELHECYKNKLKELKLN